jgi:hypothetical protein
MDDLKVMKQVFEWYEENHHLFKTDTYYGINIICELYELVKKCSIQEN